MSIPITGAITGLAILAVAAIVLLYAYLTRDRPSGGNRAPAPGRRTYRLGGVVGTLAGRPLASGDGMREAIPASPVLAFAAVEYPEPGAGAEDYAATMRKLDQMTGTSSSFADTGMWAAIPDGITPAPGKELELASEVTAARASLSLPERAELAMRRFEAAHAEEDHAGGAGPGEAGQKRAAALTAGWAKAVERYEKSGIAELYPPLPAARETAHAEEDGASDVDPAEAEKDEQAFGRAGSDLS